MKSNPFTNCASASSEAGFRTVFLTFCLMASALFPQLKAARAYSEGPVISEFLASNNNGLADQFLRKEDWIELHNPTSAPVDITDWYLTDDATNLTKWKIPAKTLAPSAYFVIFASSNNLVDPAASLHTNFKLTAGGEYLALVMPDGVTVAWEYAPAFPAQLSDISYGLTATPDGEGGVNASEYFYTTPTPGAVNVNSTLGLIPDVGFSAERGYFSTPFSLTLTNTTPGAVIRYTLDGSAPTATTGTVYSGPISIATTTNVRAAAFLSGYTTFRPETRTYLYLANIITQPKNVAGWPSPTINVGSGSKVHDYEMDPTIVTDPAYQSDLVAGMTEIPTLSLTVDKNDMWSSTGTGGFYRGIDVKKPASVEYINPQNPAENVQGDCSVEGHSHDRMKRSLRISFSSAYGETNFDSNLLTGSPFFGTAANRKADKIVLRAGNNRGFARSWNPTRSTYTEDEWFRTTQIAMGNVGSPGRFVHLYINGLYWGLYNAVERPDSDFASRQLGGDGEDWFSVSHGGEAGGLNTRFNYLKGTLASKDMSVSVNYEELKGYLDVSGFVDYLLSAWYMGINDWPTNNWWGGNRNDPAGPFQFFAWDGEWSWGVGNSSNLTAWVHPAFRSSGTTAPASVFWQSAKKSPEFMMLVADRVYKHTSHGGALETTIAVQRWNDINNHIRKPIVAESARWGDVMQTPPSRRDVEWQAEVDRIRNLMEKGAVDGLGTNSNAKILVAAMRTEGYYPAIDPPTMNQEGGVVPGNFNLTLTNPNSSGSIYYTLNGTDPRLPGGALNPAAFLYSGPINIDYSLTVKARVRQSSTWTAANESSFVSPGASPLQLTEIMYNPTDSSPAEVLAGFADDELFEFMELKNVGDQALDLTDASFTKGVTFAFGSKVLAPGELVLLVRDAAAFEFRYGSSIATDGVYTGVLDNAGEQLRMKSASGEVLMDVTYGNAFPWPDSANGDGRSMVLANSIQPGSPASWRPSKTINGNPKSSDSLAIPPGQDLVTYSGIGSSSTCDSSGLFSVTRLLGTDAVEISPQWSNNLVQWHSGGVVRVSEVTGSNGFSTISWKLDPLPPAVGTFFRVGIFGKP